MDLRTLIAVMLLALVGCKDEAPDDQDMSAAPDLAVAPDLGVAPDLAGSGAIVAPMRTWTWVDVPGSTCNEGTPTGIGVYLTGSKQVFLYLFGGGACWDYQSCFVDRTASVGPIGKQQFDALRLQPPAPPFDTWNWIMVPYCTGDLHGGDNAPTYTAANQPAQVFRHKGYANMRAYLARLSATFPQIDKLLLAGSSAGGFGTLMNYEQVRAALPAGRVYVLDDSGPPLLNQDLPQPLFTAWKAAWKLDTTLGPVCAACADNLSATLTEYARKHPTDRVALVAFLQDAVLRRYLGNKSGPDMEAALRRLGTRVIDPLASTRYFFIPGESHVVFPNLVAYNVKGVNLGTWFLQMLNDNPGWKSVAP